MLTREMLVSDRSIPHINNYTSLKNILKKYGVKKKKIRPRLTPLSFRTKKQKKEIATCNSICSTSLEELLILYRFSHSGEVIVVH